MNKRSLIVVAAFLVVIGTWWFAFRVNRHAPTVAHRSSGPVKSHAGASSPIGSEPPDPALMAAISTDRKAKAFYTILAEKNSTPQDVYGKVVDQHGSPVAGATVLGTLLWIQGFDIGERREQHSTTTDQFGEFQFVGYRASRLAIAVSKAGYEMDFRGNAYIAPNPANKTSPSERAVFVMWKLTGAEDMLRTNIQSSIPCDGTPRNFDPMTGQKDAGTLTVSLKRSPVNIDRGKPFDWTLSLSIANGGLKEITDIYPNEAPDSGYQSVTISMPADAKAWSPSAVKTYYIFDGQHYGRIKIDIMANYQPPPTHFEIEAYINPSGSRNLEFDRNKVVKTPANR